MTAPQGEGHRSRRQRAAVVLMALAGTIGLASPPAHASPPTAMLPGTTARQALTLDEILSAGLGCGSSTCTLVGQLQVRHPKFGDGHMVQLSSADGFYGGIGFVTNTRRLAWQLPTNNLMWYRERMVKDRTGKVFTSYGFGGPGEWALILRPTRQGFDDLGTASMATVGESSKYALGADRGIAFKDLNNDGRLEVILGNPVARPDGTYSDKVRHRVYRWNGKHYVPRR